MTDTGTQIKYKCPSCAALINTLLSFHSFLVKFSCGISAVGGAPAALRARANQELWGGLDSHGSPGCIPLLGLAVFLLDDGVPQAWEDQAHVLWCDALISFLSIPLLVSAPLSCLMGNLNQGANDADGGRTSFVQLYTLSTSDEQVQIGRFKAACPQHGDRKRSWGFVTKRFPATDR